MSDLSVQVMERTDPRLGRQVVHDERSRGFVLTGTQAPAIDKSTWHTKSVRVYDPLPNPNQVIGNCTMCAKAMQLNTIGNRVKGRVLDMGWATKGYSLETSIDPFPGTYPPDDTGSSGLASAKAAVQLGVGGSYWWIFTGADGVVQAIMGGYAISVGTRWDNNMFEQDSRGRIRPGGGVAGGHQYVYRGYDERHDELIGRCWWGSFRDFRIARTDADELLGDSGDAHWQASA